MQLYTTRMKSIEKILELVIQFLFKELRCYTARVSIDLIKRLKIKICFPEKCLRAITQKVNKSTKKDTLEDVLKDMSVTLLQKKN